MGPSLRIMLLASASLALSLVTNYSLMVQEPKSTTEKLSMPIVVRAEHGKAGVSYRLNAEKVPLARLLDALGELLQQKGRNEAVFVIADNDLPIDVLYNLRGILQKVGFSNARYFCVGKDKLYMGEISFGKAILYSDRPAAQP